MGLLIEHVDDPAARERLVAGLTDSNPQTRAAAARVISARAVVSLKPEVIRALSTETDDGAIGEMLKAAGTDLTRDDVPALVGAGKRLGRAHKSSIAGTLGWAAGIPPMALLQPMRDLGADRGCWYSFLAGATKRGAGLVPPLAAAALQHGDDGLWSSLLAYHADPPQVMKPELLAAALKSPNERIRAATVWYIALRYQSGNGDRPEVLSQALASAPPLENPSADFTAGFVLAKRALGTKAEDDPAVIQYPKTAQEDDATLPVSDLACRLLIARNLLTSAEASAAKGLLKTCEVRRTRAGAAQISSHCHGAFRSSSTVCLERW